jgi:hypothetical protein
MSEKLFEHFVHVSHDYNQVQAQVQFFPSSLLNDFCLNRPLMNKIQPAESSPADHASSAIQR